MGYKNIALISPSKNKYSETFILAHKNMLKGNVFYYYEGELPKKNEGGLIINSRRRRILDVIKGYFNLNEFSLDQQAIITSFKKNKIDIVLAEYGGTGERIIPICRKLGIPLIVHFHGYDASRRDMLEKHNNYQGSFSYASFIITVSNEMKKSLLSLGCPLDKLILNPYGPAKDFFEIKPSYKKKQFVSVGRFVDKKAPYYLILAFRLVLKEYPDANLVIVGKGELYNSCLNLIRYYELENSIFLVGVKGKKEIKEIFRESMAYIQHSIIAENGDMEGTPVSILEAGAAGLPVISTRHAGISDVIRDGVNGYLVEEHDVKGMAKKMIYVLKNNHLICGLGINSRDIIRENFNIERHIEILNDLIEKSIIIKD